MKISLGQFEIIRGNVAENLNRAENAIRAAAACQSDLIVLPEFWAVGFDLKKINIHADQVGSGLFQQMSEWADQYQIDICGTHPSKEGEAIYNTAVYVRKDGSLAVTYNKMHLFSLMKEDRYITPGKQLPQLFKTAWGMIGIATCFDLRFPEMIRRLALDGAELILIPAYWPQPRLEHWSLLLRARAVENQLFIVGCNRSRALDGLDFGKSAIIAPDGTAVIEAGLEPCTLSAEIDLSEVQNSRSQFPAFASRRDGMYGSF